MRGQVKLQLLSLTVSVILGCVMGQGYGGDGGQGGGGREAHGEGWKSTPKAPTPMSSSGDPWETFDQGASKCTFKMTRMKNGKSQHKFTCTPEAKIPPLTYMNHLWLPEFPSGAPEYHIEVPNYAIEDVIKTQYKKTPGTKAQIKLLLKKPEFKSIAQYAPPEIGKDETPDVKFGYEPATPETVHWKIADQMAASSGSSQDFKSPSSPSAPSGPVTNQHFEDLKEPFAPESGNSKNYEPLSGHFAPDEASQGNNGGAPQEGGGYGGRSHRSSHFGTPPFQKNEMQSYFYVQRAQSPQESGFQQQQHPPLRRIERALYLPHIPPPVQQEANTFYQQPSSSNVIPVVYSNAPQPQQQYTEVPAFAVRYARNLMQTPDQRDWTSTVNLY